MDITAKIAQFVEDTKYDKIPAQAIETVKAAILDCLGVALAGNKEQDAKICAQIARQENAKQEATVFGQGVKTSAQQAAFANGTAAHAMDFDHSFTLMGQPTAPIIPALFSLGDSLGASGKQIFEAYTVGYEVTAKLAYSLRDSKHDGWHAPSTLGCFGASAACAKLLGLNAAQTQMALGITASMAGGIVGNFGTMTKPLHFGLGARNGVLAAKLAQSGFTANAQAIEGGFGLYKVLHPTATVHEEPIEELGRSYALLSDGIRVTTPARTVLDLAGAFTRRQLERTLDQAAFLGLDLSDLAPRRGKRGAAPLRPSRGGPLAAHGALGGPPGDAHRQGVRPARGAAGGARPRADARAAARGGLGLYLRRGHAHGGRARAAAARQARPRARAADRHRAPCRVQVRPSRPSRAQFTGRRRREREAGSQL